MGQNRNGELVVGGAAGFADMGKIRCGPTRDFLSIKLKASSIDGRSRYTRGDPTEKLEAIEAIVPPHLRKGSFKAPDKLIAMLRA